MMSKRTVYGVLIALLGANIALGRSDFSDALEQVNRQCPQVYPERVLQVPEQGGFDDLDESELLVKLGHWSPAIRQSAAAALAKRGDQALPAILELLSSENGTVRAGAAEALADTVKYQLRNWQTVLPGETDARVAEMKIRSKFAPVVDVFVSMTRDPQLQVRWAAMNILSTLRPDTVEAKHAMLALTSDPDEHLAMMSMNNFRKFFTTDSVDDQLLADAITATLNQPLPRSKGSAIGFISQLDTEVQREFIPLLLAHLDWQPDRDTMFGASGQADAIEILTQWRVKALVPRLPALMTKSMRGPGLFDPCIQAIRAFGADAKPIIPQLNAYAASLEASLPDTHSRQKPGIERRIKTLKETVQYVESQ